MQQCKHEATQSHSSKSNTWKCPVGVLSRSGPKPKALHLNGWIQKLKEERAWIIEGVEEFSPSSGITSPFLLAPSHPSHPQWPKCPKSCFSMFLYLSALGLWDLSTVSWVFADGTSSTRLFLNRPHRRLSLFSDSHHRRPHIHRSCVRADRGAPCDHVAA